MWFKHKEERKSSFFPLVIIRLLLSLTMLTILSIGSYQAIKHFSGIDPIRVNPQTFLVSLIGSEEVASTVTSVLSLDFPPNLDELKRIFGDSAQVVTNSGSLQIPKLPSAKAKPVLKFAVVADSHNDNPNLDRALTNAKSKGAKFVIGLGDYTEVGDENELRVAYQTFLMSGLPFYLTAGDHDLWNARDKGDDAISHFTQVFGPPYQSFGDSNIRFVIVYNSDNYQGLDDTQIIWLKEELNKVTNNPPLATLVFIHEPLFHPSSDHFMGKVRPDLKVQADLLLQMFQEARVSGIFYGDTHFFTQYQDPKSRLYMTVVGALTGTRNTQKPRYAIVEVYDDGAYTVQDIEL